MRSVIIRTTLFYGLFMAAAFSCHAESSLRLKCQAIVQDSSVPFGNHKYPGRTVIKSSGLRDRFIQELENELLSVSARPMGRADFGGVFQSLQEGDNLLILRHRYGDPENPDIVTEHLIYKGTYVGHSGYYFVIYDPVVNSNVKFPTKPHNDNSVPDIYRIEEPEQEGSAS